MFLCARLFFSFSEKSFHKGGFAFAGERDCATYCARLKLMFFLLVRFVGALRNGGARRLRGAVRLRLPLRLNPFRKRLSASFRNGLRARSRVSERLARSGRRRALRRLFRR